MKSDRHCIVPYKDCIVSLMNSIANDPQNLTMFDISEESNIDSTILSLLQFKVFKTIIFDETKEHEKALMALQDKAAKQQKLHIFRFILLLRGAKYLFREWREYKECETRTSLQDFYCKVCLISEEFKMENLSEITDCKLSHAKIFRDFLHLKTANLTESHICIILSNLFFVLRDEGKSPKFESYKYKKGVICSVD